MLLHEYQSKQYFARFGISTPQGRTATTPQAARSAAAEFGVPVVVNAQALDNRRVFRLAPTPDDAERIAAEILALTIAGVRVRTLLIEPAADITAQFFLGIYADRGDRLLMLASADAAGGDITQIPPKSLLQETINPFLGVQGFQARDLASWINLPRENWGVFTQTAQNLYRCCLACDAVRAEINPLGLTRSGEMIALGGKLVIDDNALFRQKELASIRDEKAEHESDVQARAAGVSYARLNGKVGCIVSGAGLGMATMDLLAQAGTPASSFLDVGSNIDRNKLIAALRIVLPEAKALLINIFAEKVHCDEIAEELVAAFAEVYRNIPVVIRLAGRDAAQGHAILADASVALSTALTTREAVEQVAAAAKRSAHVDSGR
jgi:succinyl-CoA synthetase beta subunit